MFLDQQINLLTASGSDRLDGLEQGFLLEKPFAQIMLGVERGFTNQTLRLQMLTDYVFDYDDRIVQDAWTPATTALWLGRFRRETLTLQVFAYYRLGKDYWWNPALTYAVADGLNATLGYHGFGGPDEDDLVSTFSFKLYDEDDFVYVNVKYNF
jgi:hypothetical protein